MMELLLHGGEKCALIPLPGEGELLRQPSAMSVSCREKVRLHIAKQLEELGGAPSAGWGEEEYDTMHELLLALERRLCSMPPKSGSSDRGLLMDRGDED